MKISIIIASFKRPELLNIGLWSLAQQNIKYDIETIIINDGIIDDTENIAYKYKTKLNTRYIFTGKRNLNGESIFRSPSFALNIGIKQSKGDIIILTCPEIFHLNESINFIVDPLVENKQILSSPKFISFDKTDKVRSYLVNNLTLNIPNNIISSLESNNHRCRYASTLPFCMGIHKKEIVDIGGYDEDFTGFAADDDDLVGRLKLNGLTYLFNQANIIHLYHEKQYGWENRMKNKRRIHNVNLFKERKGIIIRNKNKKWGEK